MPFTVKETRGAETTGHLRYILGISLVGVIVAMAIILAVF